jgi:hypothetical protein
MPNRLPTILLLIRVQHLLDRAARGEILTTAEQEVVDLAGMAFRRAEALPNVAPQRVQG